MIVKTPVGFGEIIFGAEDAGGREVKTERYGVINHPMQAIAEDEFGILGGVCQDVY